MYECTEANETDMHTRKEELFRPPVEGKFLNAQEESALLSAPNVCKQRDQSLDSECASATLPTPMHNARETNSEFSKERKEGVQSGETETDPEMQLLS